MRGTTVRRRGGAIALATAVLSMGLVASTGGVSSAAPVSTNVALSCKGADAASRDFLDQFGSVIGGSSVGVNLTVSSPEIPAAAGLNQDIDARFSWVAGMDQGLIDASAALKPKLVISNVKVQQVVKGAGLDEKFDGNGPASTTITPQTGVPATFDIGTYGDTVTTTAGGILTYRVGKVTMTVQVLVPSPAVDVSLNIDCSPTTSNLIAKTTVRDPDAPTFEPEVLTLDAAPGATVTADLLGDIITEGKTPLLPDTLKIVDQPTGGQATIQNGVFSFTAPTEPGTYSTTVEVCGTPKADGGTPGVNEVQTVSFFEKNGDWTNSKKPVAFTLKFGEEETGLIWAIRKDANFLLSLQPDPGTQPWMDIFFGYALTEGGQYPRTDINEQVAAQLEGLAGVAPGDIVAETVYGDEAYPEVPTGVKISFTGALAEQNLPEISVGEWYSLPPSEIGEALTGALQGAGDAGEGEEGGEPAPVDARWEEIGQIADPAAKSEAAGDYMRQLILPGTNPLLNDFVERPLGDGDFMSFIFSVIDINEALAFISSLFPSQPFATTVIDGEPETPPQPLCAQGIIDVTVSETTVAVAGATATAPDGTSGTGTTGGTGLSFVG